MWGPTRSRKQGGAKGSVAVLKEATQLGCVSQDSYPRKSILRESGKLGTNHAVKLSKGTWHQITIPSRGIIQKCAPHEQPCFLPRFWIAAWYTEYYGYIRKRFWTTTCSRRTTLCSLRKFKEFGILLSRIETWHFRKYTGTGKGNKTRTAEFINTCTTLKTSVRLRIDQVMRTQNFRVQNEVVERGAVTKNQKGKKAYVARKVGECFQWKSHGQCSKGDSCSFSHEPASGNRGGGSKRTIVLSRTEFEGQDWRRWTSWA